MKKTWLWVIVLWLICSLIILGTLMARQAGEREKRIIEFQKKSKTFS